MKQKLLMMMLAVMALIAAPQVAKAQTYTVTFTASKGGTIATDYAGGVSVNNGTTTFQAAKGATVQFTVTPDKGYKLSSLIVDGFDVTPYVQYDSNNKVNSNINNIQNNRSVKATFVLRADLNNDGKQDIADLMAMLTLISNKSYNEAADLNKDKKLDMKDVKAFVEMIE
ncbi:MAG: hypothetical protein J6Z14_15100 [Prevotella sp.]|nr:hypothetical protein [Prevotella sp.]